MPALRRRALPPPDPRRPLWHEQSEHSAGGCVVIPGDPQKEAARGHERRLPDRAGPVSAGRAGRGPLGAHAHGAAAGLHVPGRKGEGETQAVLPVTISAGDVGATGREMPEGRHAPSSGDSARRSIIF